MVVYVCRVTSETERCTDRSRVPIIHDVERRDMLTYLIRLEDGRACAPIWKGFIKSKSGCDGTTGDEQQDKIVRVTHANGRVLRTRWHWRRVRSRRTTQRRPQKGAIGSGRCRSSAFADQIYSGTEVRVTATSRIVDSTQLQRNYQNRRRRRRYGLSIGTTQPLSARVYQSCRPNKKPFRQTQ